MRSGHEREFADFFDRASPRLLSAAWMLAGDQHTAEDLAQEVFVKAYSALQRFKGDSSFYTWVYRIAVNRAINYVKRRNKRTGMSLDDMDGGVERDKAYVELSAKESPFRDATLSELQQKLNDALQKLSEKHRAVVVLHDVQGVPHEEIAKMLGISSGTVRSRLFYARQLLQSELSDYAP